jgi:predicted DNA-binding transcriptional regulator YafY
MLRADRLILLLLELQAHGMRRAEDLAVVGGVSVRTTYRDMEALGRAGVPVVSLPGRGYALARGEFMPPLLFTGLEAGVLALALASGSSELPLALREASECALVKLTNVLTAESRPTVSLAKERVDPAPCHAPPAHPRLRAIREAILDHSLLCMTYHAYGHAAPRVYEVLPVGLIFYADAWHLLARSSGCGETRLFRLDRVLRVDSPRASGAPNAEEVQGQAVAAGILPATPVADRHNPTA